jgi:hypothetical protein
VVASEVIITPINGPDNTDRHIAERRRVMVHKFQLHVPAGITVSKNAEQNEKSVTTFPCTIAEGIDCVALEWFGSCPPICGLEGPGVRQRLSGWSDSKKSTPHLAHSIIPLPMKYEHTSPLTSNESDIDCRCWYWSL